MMIKKGHPRTVPVPVHGSKALPKGTLAGGGDGVAFQGFRLDLLGIAFGPPIVEKRIGPVVRDAVQPDRARSSSLLSRISTNT